MANRVEHLAYNPMLIEPDGFSTYRNPLEDHGFAVKRLCEQLVKLNTTDSDSLRMIAESTDYVRYRSLSLEGVNQEVVKQILRVLPNLHVNVALDVFLKRIQLMEYEVFRSDDVLSLKDRNFILGYVSLLRNAYETIARHESDQGWGDRWESCMRRKLEAMEDIGNFAETMLCLADWPVCFAAMAADCAIDASRDGSSRDSEGRK